MKRIHKVQLGGICGLLAATACAPTAKYGSVNLTDPSAEVVAKSAGMSTNPDGQSVNQSGRLTVDCFRTSVDASAAGASDGLKSIGIPSNCPRTSQKSQSTDGTAAKFDVAVVLDTSENMLKYAGKAKAEIALALGKLLAEQRIASLAAITFRTSVGVSEKGSDFAKTIALLSGVEPDWSPNGLKVIDPNSTDWINNTAAKAVLPAIEDAIQALKAGSEKNKLLVLVTGSTGKGSKGFDIGPTATLLSQFSSELTAKKGSLVFNYAANNSLARGLSEYAPTPIAQLDLISSAAALKPIRAELTGAIGGWGEQIVSGAKEAAVNTTEDCLVTALEGFDASGSSVFVKELKVTDTSGFQDTSLPKILLNGNFKLTITRECEASGKIVQNVSVQMGAGSESP
jgi:hypothetical protein